MTLVTERDEHDSNPLWIGPRKRGTYAGNATGVAFGPPSAGTSALAEPPPLPVDEHWPREVDLILSAIEAGRGLSVATDRRQSTRQPHRTRATLKLFSDTEDTAPWVLFTRDIDPRGVGFITRHRLPLGYGGVVTLALPDGRELRANCTLLRCREATSGWFEGALYFNRPQPLE